jgi:hypothetical protein
VEAKLKEQQLAAEHEVERLKYMAGGEAMRGYHERAQRELRANQIWLLKPQGESIAGIKQLRHDSEFVDTLRARE